MPFYVNANLILPIATIRRERRFPPDATNPEIAVSSGTRVEAETVLIRGARAGRYRIISLLEPLGVRRVADLRSEWIRVKPGDVMRAGQSLAQRGSGRRAPRAVAPVDCIVTRVDPDKIIVQADPEEVQVRALLPGIVTSVQGRTLVIVESAGALIQGAWGNGRDANGFYIEEPEGGLSSARNETLLSSIRGQMIWLNRPITNADLDTARKQEVKALIAPGMPANLRPAALAAPFAILLTEGFGVQRMAEIVYNLLRDNLKRQAAVDAALPTRESAAHPEILIPLSSAGALPPVPSLEQPLAAGLMVRMARAPYAGAIGRVVRVIETPRTLDNGLRMTGAEVALPGGQMVFVPAANLETLGRALDTRA